MTNYNFYNLVHCFVYFHNANKSEINNIYHLAEQKNRYDKEVQNEKYRQKKNYAEYEEAIKHIDRKKRNIERDKGMSISNDKLSLLIDKIKKKSTCKLFDENVYKDIKRRLSPPDCILKQGISIKLDKMQLNLTRSKEGKEKVKGVAGCGKTTILAYRAINAHKRHGNQTLILTFNITLKNYIRDKISDIQGGRDFKFVEISNYHQFFNSQVNNTGQDMKDLIDKYGLEEMYATNVFKDHETIKYHTIILDEIQDYEPEWIKIIMENFLIQDGEIIVFGDESQNIYQRGIAKSSIVIKGFGNWHTLTRSYRTSTNSPLNYLFKQFQIKYLINKYSDAEIFEAKHNQLGINFAVLKLEIIESDNWCKEIFKLIKNCIKYNNLHPNDIVILSSEINKIRRLNDFWLEQEKTHCMFETYEELSKCTGEKIDDLRKYTDGDIIGLINKFKKQVEKIRRVKKAHFYANSGLIKLSTTHSYKGLESKTVFYILDESEDPEIVYTSITRSTENLVIFGINIKNKYLDFFKRCISPVN